VTYWVLITSFLDDTKNSGKVWAIDRDHSDAGFTLVAGLQRPVALCFDVNHDFLYVVDTGLSSDSEGHIY
jgi:sugar lactone lactonase YvrE